MPTHNRDWPIPGRTTGQPSGSAHRAFAYFSGTSSLADRNRSRIALIETCPISSRTKPAASENAAGKNSENIAQKKITAIMLEICTVRKFKTPSTSEMKLTMSASFLPTPRYRKEQYSTAQRTIHLKVRSNMTG
ncbi:hypothetical protein [Caballeronia novacaledonica]|uniref:hypothetical protein n=1 Tax=Caballeronia novacaledonica TaxID=1544861 RepID=UPI0011B24CEB|nr:hypothetical protein [Caballeronia novacaledonica]